MIERDFMIKIIILIITTFFFAQVNAKEITYTDYTFDRYENIPIETDTYRSEKITLHKYYRLDPYNIYYANENYSSPERPYVNKNDIKLSPSYSKTFVDGFINHRTTAIKTDNNLKVQKILIDFANNYDELSEIEIYYSDKKINYNVQDLPDLHNNDKDTPIKNLVNIELFLENSVELNNIKVILYYKNTNEIAQDVYISFWSEEGMLLAEGDFTLDNRIGNNISAIVPMSEEDFNTFLPRYNLLVHSSVINTSIFTYYVYFRELYKYYDLEKVYYFLSELSFLDGFTYDEMEDIEVYKIYKKEIKKIDIPESACDNVKIEYSETEKKEYNSALNLTETIYPAKIGENIDAKSEPIKISNIENSKSEDNNFFQNKYIVSVFVIILIIIFTAVIHILYVKCRQLK